MEHLGMSRESYQTFSGVLCSFKNSIDPDKVPEDHKNCPASFKENNVSHKKKLLTFLSDASPHIVSQPKLEQPSKCPNLTLSFRNNDSSDLLAEISSDISLFKWKRIPDTCDIIKGHWTIEEDRSLERLVEKYGVRKWSQIAKWLYGREGKQCRERWHNHLRPDIKKGAWSEEEEHILINAHRQLGNKWSKIARTLPGRSENAIKNHFNTTKRKLLALRQSNSNSPLQSYIRSSISADTTLQSSERLKTPKRSSVKNNEVNDLLVPTHCNGGGHSSKGMESTFSSEVCTTSMPRDFIYGLKNGKKKMAFLELL